MEDPATWQNIFIVAASFDLNAEAVLAGDHGDEAAMAAFRASHLAEAEYDFSAGIVFTDDRNPVEYLVARTLRTQTPDD